MPDPQKWILGQILIGAKNFPTFFFLYHNSHLASDHSRKPSNGVSFASAK